MEYVRQYQNRINWENEPSIATPINETNLNKMDKALNYMDGKMLEVVNAIGNDKNVRNAMITSITQPRTLNAALDDYSGADQLADGDILVVKSTVEGTPTTGWILNIALTGLASVSVNLYSYNSVMFDASIQAGYGLIIKLDITNSKGYVIGIMNDNGYVRQGKKSGTTVGSYATIDGYQNTASGHSSRAGGQFNVAGYEAQEVIGKYNDNKSTTLFEVGNGTGASAKSNAFEVYANGDAVVYGTLKDGSNNEYLKGIVPITNGGTGNADGYIRTGLTDGETAATGSTVEGAENIAQGDYCHVEGYSCAATADNAHAEGTGTVASGQNSHAEGNSYAEGICAHAEGGYFNAGDYCTASGNSAHAEGASTVASADMAHAEGRQTTASDTCAHAEGYKSTASAANSHAEGYNTTASGVCSHAGGTTSVASGLHSFAQGQYVNAGYAQQAAVGRYNNNKSDNLFEVGNGTADNARSNAFEVKANGDIVDGHGYSLSAIVDAISEEKTVSGNPIVITDALPVPAKSLETTINAIQDLHGYDKPWVGGAYKNKLPMTVAGIKAINNSGTWSDNEYTFRGVVFSIVTDDAGNIIYILAKNGTATGGNANLNLAQSLTIASNGIMNGCINGGFDTYYIEALSNSQYYHSTNGDANVPSSFDSVWIGIKEGYAIPTDGIKFYPMIRLATESDSTFAPYSNICPISGRTAAVVTRSDGDEISEDFTIQLGTTVYGADINWDTGVGTLVDIRPEYDGSEAWSISNHRFAVALSPDSVNTPSEITCKCNLFAPKTASDLWSNRLTADYVGVATQGATAYVVDNVHYTNYDDTDLAAFKTALSTNKLQIAYKLATPTTIQLTPTQLTMLKGYNRVSIDNGTITLTYLANKLDALLALMQTA